MQKLTMTVKDVCQEMRQAGIPTCYRTVSEGIVSGAYPFGRVTHKGPSGRHTFQIFRVDFERWLKSKLPEEALA